MVREGRLGRAVRDGAGSAGKLDEAWSGERKDWSELDLGGGFKSSEWIEEDDELGRSVTVLRFCLDATTKPLFLAKDEEGGGDTEDESTGPRDGACRPRSTLASSREMLDEGGVPADVFDNDPRSSSSPVAPAPAPFNPTSLCLLLKIATGTFFSSTIVSSASSSSSSSARALLFLFQSPDCDRPRGGKTGRAMGDGAMSSSVDGGGGVLI